MTGVPEELHEPRELTCIGVHPVRSPAPSLANLYIEVGALRAEVADLKVDHELLLNRLTFSQRVTLSHIDRNVRLRSALEHANETIAELAREVEQLRAKHFHSDRPTRPHPAQPYESYECDTAVIDPSEAAAFDGESTVRR